MPKYTFLDEPKFSPQLIAAIKDLNERRKLIANTVVESKSEVPGLAAVADKPSISDIRDFIDLMFVEYNADKEAVAEATKQYVRDYYDDTHPEKREALVKEFYYKKDNFRLEDLDLSCLTEAGDSRQPGDGNLTKSEMDVLKYIGYVRTAQTSATKKRENLYIFEPLAALDGLTNMSATNRAYAAELGSGMYVLNNILQTNGFTHDLEPIPEGHAMEEAMEQNAIINSGIRMASGLAVSAAIGAAELDKPVESLSIKLAWMGKEGLSEKASEVFESLFNPVEFQANQMGQDMMDQIYVDGKSIKRTFWNNAKFQSQAAQKAYVMELLLSGEHDVAMAIPAHNTSDELTAQVIHIDVDLRASDAKYKEENFSWFRRTFFDWGPFKIETPADKAQKLVEKNAASKAETDSEIKEFALSNFKTGEEQYAQHLQHEKLGALNNKVAFEEALRLTAKGDEITDAIKASRILKKDIIEQRDHAVAQKFISEELNIFREKIGSLEESMKTAVLDVPSLDKLFQIPPKGLTPEQITKLMGQMNLAMGVCGKYYERGLDLSDEALGKINAADSLRKLDISSKELEELKAMPEGERKTALGGYANEACRELFALSREALNSGKYRDLATADSLEGINVELEKYKENLATVDERLVQLKTEEMINNRVRQINTKGTDLQEPPFTKDRLDARWDFYIDAAALPKPTEADMENVRKLAAAQLKYQDANDAANRIKTGMEQLEKAQDHLMAADYSPSFMNPNEIKDYIGKVIKDVDGFGASASNGLEENEKKIFDESMKNLHNYMQNPSNSYAQDYSAADINVIWQSVTNSLKMNPDTPELRNREAYTDWNPQIDTETYFKNRAATASAELDSVREQTAQSLERIATAKVALPDMKTVVDAYKEVNPLGRGYIDNRLHQMGKSLDEVMNAPLYESIESASKDPAKMWELAATEMVKVIMPDLTAEQKAQAVDMMKDDERFKNAVGSTAISIKNALKDPEIPSKLTEVLKQPVQEHEMKNAEPEIKAEMQHAMKPAGPMA